MNKDELGKIREEIEALRTWRNLSREEVAEQLEVCAVCGRVRDREHLVRCPACADVFICEDGLCAWLHHARLHPSTPLTV